MKNIIRHLSRQHSMSSWGFTNFNSFLEFLGLALGFSFLKFLGLALGLGLGWNKMDLAYVCMSWVLYNSIFYIGFMYMYVSRIIFCMVLSTWLHNKLLYEGLHNLFALPNLQTPSSSPKLYSLHFKKLFWCLLNVNFCHNNFAKLHHSHMTLDRSEILVKYEKLCLLSSLKILAHLTS